MSAHRLPAEPPPARCDTPPKYLDHLFWNVDRSSLNLDSDGAFIALRISAL